MIQQQEYIQLKAFARQYGAMMGLFWVLSFACFVGSTREPMLSFAFDFSIALVPFLAHFFVRQYRDGVIGGCISFRRAVGFSVFIFFYATLILAIAQWIYFQYLDGGMLVGHMMKIINTPEFEEALKANQLDKKQITDQLELLSETRPIDFALAFMWMNIFAGVVISWIVALFTKRTKPSNS